MRHPCYHPVLQHVPPAPVLFPAAIWIVFSAARAWCLWLILGIGDQRLIWLELSVPYFLELFYLFVYAITNAFNHQRMRPIQKAPLKDRQRARMMRSSFNATWKAEFRHNARINLWIIISAGAAAFIAQVCQTNVQADWQYGLEPGAEILETVTVPIIVSLVVAALCYCLSPGYGPDLNDEAVTTSYKAAPSRSRRRGRGLLASQAEAQAYWDGLGEERTQNVINIESETSETR